MPSEATSILPLVNACLNGTAATLLVFGRIAIAQGRRETHARLMVAAFAFSTAFLASYLWYHFGVQEEVGPTRFNGSGWTRPAYFVLLVTHVLGAVVNLPMVLRTLWLAHRGDFERHRAWARWSFPLWLYVSVTGVAVYVVLYHLNPAHTSAAAPAGS